ncbi:uncharacterized protein LOC111259903 [Varroa jacobsoni]|uniref:Uncharacterized protein n=1 Tax=Varroa destructor TaxID=109461 RepID=A0A7M7JGY9_VARDE|nr:uncharacterized protein LOC111246523 [Varroa destructor]XP_022688009.1 uncharacterized protein LOC111259903 [Varroa jacobsoni]
MARTFRDVKLLLYITLLMATGYVQLTNANMIMKLAAAAAIFRGGPTIPIPIRYPVHIPYSKVLEVPVHHPVPVKIPVHHHTHSVKKIPILVHSHSHSERQVPIHSHSHSEKAVHVPIHHHSESHHDGHVEIEDGHGWQHGWHDIGSGGAVAGGGFGHGLNDIKHDGHAW